MEFIKRGVTYRRLGTEGPNLETVRVLRVFDKRDGDGNKTGNHVVLAYRLQFPGGLAEWPLKDFADHYIPFQPKISNIAQPKMDKYKRNGWHDRNDTTDTDTDTVSDTMSAHPMSDTDALVDEMLAKIDGVEVI